MTKPAIATMSKIGFIVDEIPLILAKQLDYYFQARRNQSTYISGIESFEYVLAENQGNKEMMLKSVKDSITTLYKELFDRVDVTTKANPDTPEAANFTLIISVRVTYNGTPYDLAESVLVTGQTYKRIQEGRANASVQ